MGNPQETQQVGVTPATGGGNGGSGGGEPSWGDVLKYPLACTGAVVGAVVGAWVVKLGSRSGFYAIPLVGLATGYGAILLARKNTLAIGFITAAVAIAASLLTEWWLFPFTADGSLEYFVRHVGTLPGFSLLLHGVGMGVAFWIGWRR